jgi:hypothetical protein
MATPSTVAKPTSSSQLTLFALRLNETQATLRNSHLDDYHPYHPYIGFIDHLLAVGFAVDAAHAVEKKDQVPSR